MENINTYRDTRGNVLDGCSFCEAVIEGIAPGGGLFVPDTIPTISLEEICSLARLPYAQQAARIYQLFGVDLPADTIDTLMAASYGSNFDDERICPLVEVSDGMHVLELWHGPTSAFKDMALQCLPHFFSSAIEVLRAQGKAKEDYLILVATSGDTGKAALEGFADRAHTSIIVFFPNGGVSDVQRLQMVTQSGDNVGVFGVHGNFDDCQTSVKAAFNDASFNEHLATARNIKLSSANSINWGRLLPQIIYYVSAYGQMVKSNSIAAGDLIDVCVPTGNFGNILAAYYAKRMGTPIDKLFCASNENCVLSDFIRTGIYDISSREFVLTPSPSMDILVSSNLERQLFELSGRNTQAVKGWMNDLASKKRFQVDDTTFAKMSDLFVGDFVTNEDCFDAIRTVFETCNYLLDPHTAVAWVVAQRLKRDNPVLVASTAHWAKFGASVYRALEGIAPNQPLPPEIANLNGIELNRLVAHQTGHHNIPAGLDALESLPVRFEQTVDGSAQGIQGAVDSFFE